MLIARGNILLSCINIEMKERMAATRAATPATMIVALVSSLPVPELPEASAISWSRGNNMVMEGAVDMGRERPQSLASDNFTLVDEQAWLKHLLAASSLTSKVTVGCKVGA